jgi:ribosomal protein L37E
MPMSLRNISGDFNMSTQWECFRCNQMYNAKVKSCPNCGTPQPSDPAPEYANDKTWIVVVTGAIIIGIVTPFALYFLR